MIGRRTLAVAALATKVVIIIEIAEKTRTSANTGRDLRPNMYVLTACERPDALQISESAKPPPIRNRTVHGHLAAATFHGRTVSKLLAAGSNTKNGD